jgi:hypothetical protein
VRDGWSIDSLQQTAPPGEFVNDLLSYSGSTLAGFDFPIGLPFSYTKRAGFELRDLLSDPLSYRAQRFLTPAETFLDISLEQPFYRTHPKGGRQRTLLDALGCRTFNDLLRECDKGTCNRTRAEAIFWTVGPKQVGKAALAGWRDILIAAVARGAQLWPFDGPLASLDSNPLTIAETYPAEAYQHVGMPRTIKKRSQEGRRASGLRMLKWASDNAVNFSPGIEGDIRNGFGESKDGEDPFDALAGLCGLIEVADGRRAEAPDLNSFSNPGEGWILGQIDIPHS